MHRVPPWPAGPAGLATARGWAAPAAPACAAGAPERRPPARHPRQTRCANAIVAVQTWVAGRRTEWAEGPAPAMCPAYGIACSCGLGVHASCGRCASAHTLSRCMPRAAAPQRSFTRQRSTAGVKLAVELRNGEPYTQALGQLGQARRIASRPSLVIDWPTAYH